MYNNERIESDSSENDKRQINKSRYEEYDSKPIKPLDPKFLNIKLSEYPELRLQEIDELKLKSARNTLAKTTEQPKILQPKQVHKMPVRQLSFNSSNSNAKLNQGTKPAANASASPIKIRKRSKTHDDLKTNRVAKPSNLVSVVSPSPSASKQPKTKNNPERYSPKINKTNIQPKVDSRRNQPHNKRSLSPKKETKNIFLKDLSKKNLLVANLSEDEFLDDKSSKFNSPVKPVKLTEKDQLPISSNSNAQTEGLKLLDESSSVLLNVSNKLSFRDQIQHLEIQSKIQQRQEEMRLQREKNLLEFKNLSKSHVESQKNKERVFIPKNLTCNIYYY